MWRRLESWRLASTRLLEKMQKGLIFRSVIHSISHDEKKIEKFDEPAAIRTQGLSIISRALVAAFFGQY